MRKGKKYIALMLFIVLTISFSSYRTYSAPSEWAMDSINVLLENGFINEDHLADDKIKSNITREEFADLVVKLYSKATNTAMEDIVMEDPFDDTDNPMVLKAYSLGIVKGISDHLFSPEKEITRQEIATMFLSAINLFNIETMVYEEAQFEDMDKVAQWAKDAINFTAQEGILHGKGNNLMMPLEFTTWEEAIVLVNRILEKYGYLEVISPEEIPEEKELSMDDLIEGETGFIIPEETELLVEAKEDAGLHLRLIAKGNQGNRDLAGKIDEVFEILKVNEIPQDILDEFKQLINDNWTVFNAPQIGEPVTRVLEDGKRIELCADLDMQISIYSPFLNVDGKVIPKDLLTKLDTGYMAPKNSQLVIRTNDQMGTKLEVTIFDTEDTETIISKLNELFAILKVNDIPEDIIERIERDITSSWNYDEGKPGQVNPQWEELSNGDQLVYSSRGFVQVKIFNY